MDTDRVSKTYLTIDNAPDQTVDRFEDRGRFLMILVLVFGHVAFPVDLCMAKHGLNDERDLLSWQVNVHRYWKADRWRLVDGLVDALLALTKANLRELRCLRYS